MCRKREPSGDAGMSSDLPVISSGELAATINPLGAELWSLRDGDGRELLTDADPKWWTGRRRSFFRLLADAAIMSTD
jgi:hypothetical protein